MEIHTPPPSPHPLPNPHLPLPKTPSPHFFFFFFFFFLAAYELTSSRKAHTHSALCPVFHNNDNHRIARHQSRCLPFPHYATNWLQRVRSSDQGPYAPQGSTSLLPKLSVTSKVSAPSSYGWVGSRVRFRSSEDETLLEFTSPVAREYMRRCRKCH